MEIFSFCKAILCQAFEISCKKWELLYFIHIKWWLCMVLAYFCKVNSFWLYYFYYTCDTVVCINIGIMHLKKGLASYSDMYLLSNVFLKWKLWMYNYLLLVYILQLQLFKLCTKHTLPAVQRRWAKECKRG